MRALECNADRYKDSESDFCSEEHAISYSLLRLCMSCDYQYPFVSDRVEEFLK
jgi:hypothetical protein